MNRKEWTPASDIILEDNADIALREENNILITAGPGAGKTELLAQKACYLFQTGLCDYPHRILAVSFKVDAATNLAERVKERCGIEYESRFTSVTFDAFAKTILDKFRNTLPKQYQPTHDYAINDDDVMSKIRNDYCSGDKKQFEKMVKRECLLVASGNNDNTEIIQAMINNPDGTKSHLNFLTVFSLALYILKHNPLVVEAIRRTYKYAFIDEFQDTTALQYQMLEVLFLEGKSVLTAVGDNKQRIMLWAGAMRDAFDRFQNDFNAVRVPLLRNYRSAPKLVELQARMYESLGEKSLPALTSDAWSSEDGEIELVISNDDEAEAQYLANNISKAISSGIKPEEICILSKQRIEKYASSIIKSLSDVGIESRLEANYQEILSDPLIRLIINCMYISLGSGSPAFKQTVKDDLLSFRSEGEIESFSEFAKAELELNSLLSKLSAELNASSESKSSEEILHIIIDWIGEENIQARYPIYRQSGKLEKQITLLAKTINNILPNARNPLSALDKLCGKGVIPIMTIHKSKGLEYRRIYFLGLEDDAFWSFKNQPEEDRCAFFVALSRAKESITFTFSKYRLGKTQHHNSINEFYVLLQSPGAARVSYI